MKRIAVTLIFIILPLFSNEASASNSPPMEIGAQICYGYAMVGYDSVINSRLGVPAEYALGLAIKKPLTSTAEASYSTHVLNIVLGAYMWQDNPHDYAIRVFYDCAKTQGANLDLENEL